MAKLQRWERDILELLGYYCYRKTDGTLHLVLQADPEATNTTVSPQDLDRAIGTFTRLAEQILKRGTET